MRPGALSTLQKYRTRPQPSPHLAQHSCELSESCNFTAAVVQPLADHGPQHSRRTRYSSPLGA